MQKVWIVACIPKIFYGFYLVAKAAKWASTLGNTIDFWLLREQPSNDWQCLQESIGSDTCRILPSSGSVTRGFPHGSGGATSTPDFDIWRQDCQNNVSSFIILCIILAVMSVLVTVIATGYIVYLLKRGRQVYPTDIVRWQQIEAALESVLWLSGALIFLFQLSPRLLPTGGAHEASNGWGPHTSTTNNVGLPRYYGSTFCPWAGSTSDIHHSTECPHFPSNIDITSVRITADNSQGGCESITAWRDAQDIPASGACRSLGHGLIECCIQVDSFFPCGKSSDWYTANGLVRPSSAQLCQGDGAAGDACQNLDLVLGFAYSALFHMYVFGLVEGLWDVVMMASAIKTVLDGLSLPCSSCGKDGDRRTAKQKVAAQVLAGCLVVLLPAGAWMGWGHVMVDRSIECRTGEIRVDNVCEPNGVASPLSPHTQFHEHPECIDPAYIAAKDNYTSQNCKDGFTGSDGRCDVPIPFCQRQDTASPCQHGGTCCSLRGARPADTPTTPPACVNCDPGWNSTADAPFCNSSLPYCEWQPNLCQNGGVCVSGGHLRHSCTCQPGWGGSTCGDAKPYCDWHENPCGLSGTCVSTGAHSYTCSCTAGWGGDACTLALSFCDWNPNPCGNCIDRTSPCGTCVSQGSHNYTCHCAPLWRGQTCSEPRFGPLFYTVSLQGLAGSGVYGQIPGHNCNNDNIPSFAGPLGSNGFVDQSSQYSAKAIFYINHDGVNHHWRLGLLSDEATCSAIGWRFCYESVDTPDRCSSWKDDHNSDTNMIVSLASDYSPPPPPPFCVWNDNPCLSGGTCVSVSATEFSCTCIHGRTGHRCETIPSELTWCEWNANPCQHGGKCTSTNHTSYTCACTGTGWTGRLCERDTCTTVDCGDHGTCVPHTHSCACDFGWAGVNCDYSWVGASAASQCARPYTNVTDTWRTVSNANGVGPNRMTMGDIAYDDMTCQKPRDCNYACTNEYARSGDVEATGLGGGQWFRFTGMGGTRLPVRPRGAMRGGTRLTSWLTKWNQSKHPSADAIDRWIKIGVGAGRYPSIDEGVTPGLVCFDDSGTHCSWTQAVALVQCDGFLLWWLPYVNSAQPQPFQYKQLCAAGYSAEMESRDTGACALEPCWNSGTCELNHTAVRGYTCQCVSGWGGENCTSLVDDVGSVCEVGAEICRQYCRLDNAECSSGRFPELCCAAHETCSSRADGAYTESACQPRQLPCCSGPCNTDFPGWQSSCFLCSIILGCSGCNAFC
eukprot:COSAG01_NODE_159_length_23702_cov_119.507585_15_plen_1233_part_00